MNYTKTFDNVTDATVKQVTKYSAYNTAELTPKTLTTPHITAEEREIIQDLETTRFYILTIGTSLIVLLGIPGNYFTIKVLNRETIKDRVFSGYLSSMCTINIATLVVSAVRLYSMAFLGTEFIVYTYSICVVVKWVTFTLISTSTWHLVFISGLRLLYIGRRTRVLVLLFKPVKIALSIGIFCGAIIMLLVASGMTEGTEYGGTKTCLLSDDSWIIVLMGSFYSIGPSIVIVFFNCTLFMALKYDDPSLSESANDYKVRQHLMFLGFVSSVQFTMTSLPVALFLINSRYIFRLDTPIGLAQYELGYYITTLVLFFNNASSFITYCCFGSNFRRESGRMMKSWLLNVCPGCCFLMFYENRSRYSFAETVNSSKTEPTTLLSKTKSFKTSDGMTSADATSSQTTSDSKTTSRRSERS